ncbi:MAG: Zn-binding domain-containing protein, partial [Caldilinea sp.]
GVNDFYLQANRLENLMLLCRTCHRRLETAGRLTTGLDGLAHLLSNLAPLYLMCDRSDLGAFVARGTPIGRRVDSKPPAAVEVNFYTESAADVRTASTSQTTETPRTAPRVYLFERVPAGLGFSLLLYDLHDQLLAAAYAIVHTCACSKGCPACVGPVLDDQPVQLDTKRLTLALLERLV